MGAEIELQVWGVRDQRSRQVDEVFGPHWSRRGRRWQGIQEPWRVARWSGACGGTAAGGMGAEPARGITTGGLGAAAGAEPARG